MRCSLALFLAAVLLCTASGASTPPTAPSPSSSMGGSLAWVSEARFRADVEALGTSASVVVLYHELDCPLSKSLRAQAAQLPARFPEAYFAAMEVSETSSAMLSSHGIFSYPALLAFPASGKARQRFEGERAVPEMVAWLESATGATAEAPCEDGVEAWASVVGRWSDGEGTPPCGAREPSQAETDAEQRADTAIAEARAKEALVASAAFAWIALRVAVWAYGNRGSTALLLVPLARMLDTKGAWVAAKFGKGRMLAADHKQSGLLMAGTVACGAVGAYFVGGYGLGFGAYGVAAQRALFGS